MKRIPEEFENKNRIIRIGIKVRQDMSYVSSWKKSRDEVGGTSGKKGRKSHVKKNEEGSQMEWKLFHVCIRIKKEESRQENSPRISQEKRQKEEDEEGGMNIEHIKRVQGRDWESLELRKKTSLRPKNTVQRTVHANMKSKGRREREKRGVQTENAGNSKFTENCYHDSQQSLRWERKVTQGKEKMFSRMHAIDAVGMKIEERESEVRRKEGPAVKGNEVSLIFISNQLAWDVTECGRQESIGCLETSCHSLLHVLTSTFKIIVLCLG